MKGHIFSEFRDWSIKNGIVLLGLSSLLGASGVIAITKSNQNKTINISSGSQSIQESETVKNSPIQELIPMPSAELGIALTKVESKRDPFQQAPVTESNRIDILRSAIQFNGIARSGETLVAIIKTEEGQHFYKIGDKLKNGFIIKKISEADVTADISNGIKNYRLSLESFRSEL